MASVPDVPTVILEAMGESALLPSVAEVPCW